MTIYRGYEIVKTPAGHYEWTDERGFVHNGKIDTRGGYDTEEAAMNDIDRYKKNLRIGGGI
jgi:hypothetical protein